MDKIEWCCKQKAGIVLINPNENIAKDYFKKAEDSLTVMQTVEIIDWKIISAYYACYDCLYALLQKAGVKCEIHDCTIALMKFFNFNEEEIQFMNDLKDKRIKAHYYTKEIASIDENKIKAFMLGCRELNNELDFNVIRKGIIKKLSKYMN